MKLGKKKKRGGIAGFVLKEKEGENDDDNSDAGSWDKNDFDVGGKDGAEWGNSEKGNGDNVNHK